MTRDPKPTLLPRQATPMLPIIDAHQHFWDLSLGQHPWLCGGDIAGFRYGDYEAIKKNYLPADYFRDAANFNVVKTVHMEAEWNPSEPLGETNWLTQLHDQTGYPNAIVGQAWFARDDIAEVLAGQAKAPLMRSIRQKPAAAPAPDKFRPGLPGSLADPKFRAGYARLANYGLHFDLQTPWWHFGEAADLARQFPDITVILNHTGLPADRAETGLQGWRAAMLELAAEPNVAVKISGICIPNNKWTAAANAEIVLDTIQMFGVDRCMFASNFPVDSLWASFDEIFTGFTEITASLTPIEQRKLFHDTAEKFYRPV